MAEDAMIEGIETLYRVIGESINAAIKSSWSKASIEATFFSEHIYYVGDYTESDGVTESSFAPNEVTRRAFEELRELFKRSKEKVWCRATFEMTSDGKFKMTWGYDDCDENGFARFDAE